MLFLVYFFILELIYYQTWKVKFPTLAIFQGLDFLEKNYISFLLFQKNCQEVEYLPVSFYMMSCFGSL